MDKRAQDIDAEIRSRAGRPSSPIMITPSTRPSTPSARAPSRLPPTALATAIRPSRQGSLPSLETATLPARERATLSSGIAFGSSRQCGNVSVSSNSDVSFKTAACSISNMSRSTGTDTSMLSRHSSGASHSSDMAWKQCELPDDDTPVAYSPSSPKIHPLQSVDNLPKKPLRESNSTTSVKSQGPKTPPKPTNVISIDSSPEAQSPKKSKADAKGKKKAVDIQEHEGQAKALKQSPFYGEIMRVLKNRFRLGGFRQNQLEAITATLEGKDVFVLMPTGG